jgi:glutaminyl-tRNA synthetase
MTEITENSNNMHRTRFPPEPNGYLHLGHLKAMMFDFDLYGNDTETKTKGSECILRIDDTNPEAENEEYVQGIIDDVKWMGYRYSKLTYTSDYFHRLYDCAVALIKMDCAYVDFSSPDEIKTMRHSGVESSYRSDPIDIQLTRFDDMKKGKYKENEAVLRLKIDMMNVNHNLRDPIAYRIKTKPHHRTKQDWIVYPSYDYSHGLVDAFEEITDSFCTMEFYVRRDQYYWPVLKLKDMFNLNPARVLEFGKLNIEGVVLSKRKIIPLIETNVVSGFDDPRLYTIRGLRRRGFTPEILKNIVSHTGMGRADSCISRGLIEHELRSLLDKTSHRSFAVMDPINVTIVGETDTKKEISVLHPNHPVDKTKGTHFTKLTDSIVIEKNDFREVDAADYYRLAPGKVIRLKYADFVKYESHEKNNNMITVKDWVPDKPKKIKGVIHWLSDDSPCAEFEIYDDLYNTDGTINHESKINRFSGYVEKYVMDSILENNGIDLFQFERLGYFKFDHFKKSESSASNTNHRTLVPVFIRTIELTDTYNNIKH